MRGTLRGTQYRNTVRTVWQIPKYRVENRPNTNNAFMIGDAYFTLYPSRVFFFLISQARIHQKSTSTFAIEKTWEDLELISTTIEN